ncbi:MAG: hypothetical protein WBD36_12450 [Bacteroidota bacterium]
MKQYRHALIACCLFFGVQGLIAQEGFGLGVIIGEPTGISAKLWTSSENAFDFGLGWSVGGDRIVRYDGNYNGGSRVHFHLDYVWHSFDAIHSSERFPVYYGFGGHLNNGAGYNSSMAVRGVIGVLWLPRDTPIDVFIEMAPSLQLTSSTGFGIDAGIGARYFF